MPFPTRALPDAQALRDAFRYDPETGHLYWRRALGTSNVKVGAVAGCPRPDGYVDVSFGGELWKAHRIIWKIVTGEDPVEVDHINRQKSDNRWCNLRNANRFQQMHNIPSKKKALPRGVTRHSNGYRARITVKTKTIALGYFRTVAEAEEAYRKAAQRYHGEFAFN